MSFYEWWESLTNNERKLLGENNAKFVWTVAHKEGYLEGSRDGYGEAVHDTEEVN